MFYGVTVLEGEAKSSAIGRGKDNESSWCEKRIVTSRLSVSWRCMDTKFYLNIFGILEGEALSRPRRAVRAKLSLQVTRIYMLNSTISEKLIHTLELKNFRQDGVDSINFTRPWVSPFWISSVQVNVTLGCYKNLQKTRK
jgi:hypothetical protein